MPDMCSLYVTFLNADSTLNDPGQQSLMKFDIRFRQADYRYAMIWRRLNFDSFYHPSSFELYTTVNNIHVISIQKCALNMSFVEAFNVECDTEKTDKYKQTHIDR